MHHGIFIWLIIGGIAGWIAGLLVKGGGFGLIVDIIGAFIGGWLAGILHLSIGGSFFGSIIVSVIGAVILLFAIRLIRRVA